MSHYVADYMKAVGDDPTRQEKAREVLRDRQISYTENKPGGAVQQETEIVDVNFARMEITYNQGFLRKKMTGSFEFNSYKPRFVGEPPALPE